MDKKKFGYYVFGGLLLGAILDGLWSASSNSLAGIGNGTLFGVKFESFNGLQPRLSSNQSDGNDE